LARTRSTPARFVRLLDAAAQPVYALDGAGQIVYCNHACLQWIGVEADAIVGRRCVYSSDASLSGADAIAAGLCPPPEVQSGHSASGVVITASGGGLPRRRRASFFPFSDRSGGPAGLVAVVEPTDLLEVEGEAAAVSESALLHQRLRAFRRRAVERLNLDLFLGDTPAIRRARAQARVAVATTESVLIVGPPGSGRQRLAAAVHYAAGAGSAGSLIPLACSILSGELLDSTIRALSARRTEESGARHATLLLNDVDSLAADVQPLTVAALASGTFPLRLLATARRPLSELVRAGEFREDLAVLLDTITIVLPPLAERRPDIPLLAQAFVEELNARGAKQRSGFSPVALDRLDGYSWPGNLDELAAVVREAFERSSGPEILPSDLPKRIELAFDAAAHPRRREERIVVDEFLARIERELIDRALAQSKGNKAKAARLLGVTRPRLYRRMVQLGLEPDRGEHSE